MKSKISVLLAAIISLMCIQSVFADTEKRVDYYKDYVPYQLTHPAVYSDNTIYVPVDEGAVSMGITDFTYDWDNGIMTYNIFDNQIVMKMGEKTVSVYGEERTLDAPPKYINDYPYAPLVPLAEMFSANCVIQDEGTHFNAVVSDSEYAAEIAKRRKYEAFINGTGIGSDTDYLVWVKKGEYKVRVFLGKKGNWRFNREFTCAIGAPSTPTCTGVYRIYSKEARWTYPSNYVGPILRFNGGYALHSTLLRYDGTPYDNRVGCKISHGCVRLRKDDINWLNSYLPLYTRVYITE